MVIRKSGVGPNKDVVFACDTPPNLNTVLDGDVIAEHRTILNKRALADIAMRADLGSL
jgi:hypothetical protein